MSKLSKEIVSENLHIRIARGLEKVYQVACAAYGPNAGTALIEMNYGDPLISRDGVTNVEKVYLEDSVENMAARTVVQASKKNNKKVGDGTTAVVILAYHLYKEAQEMIASGMNPMVVSRDLENTATLAIDILNMTKKPVNDNLLRHVAKVSAGDQAVGEMIADVIKEVGINGGVTVEDFAGAGIFNELVDGFYFRKGFTNINLTTDPSNLESRHEKVDIFLTEKPMRLTTDIAPILEKIVQQGGKELVIIGDVSEEALGILIVNRLKGIITTTVVDAPVYGPLRSLFFDDLATVIGAKVFLPGANASDFSLDMLGGAEKVIANEFSTTIIGGDGNQEDITGRIEELKEQLKAADSPITIEALRDRLSQLTGKVAIIRVGGATEIEQGEVKLRVQDAICAVQAAIQDGILPGGGVALARLDLPNFTKAFQEPFKQLALNAGVNSEKALWTTLEKSYWYGYDFKGLDKPVDLLKAGIIDPSSVIKEVVINATSVVSKLITAKVGIVLANREEKHD